MNDNININDSHLNPSMTFRRLCFLHMQQLTNFPYIEKDFDALTDYELLCLVVKYLNDVINNSNKQNESITNLYNAFLQLQDYMNGSVQELEDAFNELNDYVRDYFANLDVQDEINNKLDEMLEDGVLEQIIEQFIQSTALWCFNTVNDMKNATNLINGSYVKTLGYYNEKDGGESIYYITDTESLTDYQEELDNGLYATLIVDDVVSVNQLGAYGDGTHDDTVAINNTLNYYGEDKKVIFRKGTYLCNISTDKSVDIDFCNSKLIPVNSNSVISISGTSESTGYVLQSSLNRYDTTIVLNGSPNYQVGDYIMIRDDSLRPGDDQANINNEVHQIKSINGNTIIIKDFIRYRKSIATDTLNVYKLNMINNIHLKNVELAITGNSTGIFVRNGVNVNISNVIGYNNVNPLIGLYSSVNININNFNLHDAVDVTAGKGYGILIDHGCNNWNIINGVGANLRHLIDPSSSFDGKIKNVNAYDMQQVSYGFAHNTYGSDITYENCNAYNQKWYGFSHGKQGVTDRNSFIGYNFNIINSEITFSEVASNQIGIMMETPVENSIIENVKINSVNSGTGIRLNPVNNKINIHDCFLEGLSYGVFIEETAVAEKTDKKYMINFDNISINNCGYGIRFANVKEIKINKTTASNITNNIIHFGGYTSAKTQPLKYIEITNTIMDDSTFIGYQGASENVISDTGVFGKITNNVRDKDLPIDITCTASSRIVSNTSDLYSLIPSPDDLYFPIKSESAIALATASLTYGIVQNQKCIIQNVGEYNITIPEGFLMKNGGSNYVLEPNKCISYIYKGTSWNILKD